MATHSFNVYVGAETGFIKGINTWKSKFANLNTFKNLSKSNEITSMCWGHEGQQEIYLGLRDQTVKVLNTKTERFVKTINVTNGTGPLKGVGLLGQDQLITCTESGVLNLWNINEQQNQSVTIKVGDHVSHMKQNPDEPWQVATGGKETELKIWDLNAPDKPKFTAKNVPNDFLDLRVPVWICDMVFVTGKQQIITSTGYHQVRLYDLRTGKRRPTLAMEFDEYPITAISLAHRENQVVVGNSRGRMAMLDLRRRLLVHSFKGFAGGIRSIQCHPDLPIVASCGLDRFVRLHDLDKHKLTFKIYLKSRLNCLLMRDEFGSEKDETKESAEEIESVPNKVIDAEDIWKEMDVVSDEEGKRKADVGSIDQKRKRLKKKEKK